MILLAQVTSATPQHIGEWLICAAALLSMVALGKSIFVRRPPIEAEFATKEELAALRDGDFATRKELYSSISSAKREVKDGLALRIIPLEQRLGELKTAVDDNRIEADRSLGRAHARVDEHAATLGAHSEAIANLKEKTKH